MEYMFPEHSAARSFSDKDESRGIRIIHDYRRLHQQIEKVKSEIVEVEDADNIFDMAIELFDVIHASETALRMIAKHLPDWTTIEDLQVLVEVKNEERGYYD